MGMSGTRLIDLGIVSTPRTRTGLWRGDRAPHGRHGCVLRQGAAHSYMLGLYVSRMSVSWDIGTLALRNGSWMSHFRK